MSEIEKMYKNADILKRKLCTSEMSICTMLCETCSDYTYSYPPFTAEKQIAILQFCLKWWQVHILKGIDNEYRIENSCYRQGYQPTIADAIANYINEKWEKLTPEEKQQVKGILE